MTIFDQAMAVSRRADGRYDTRPDARFALVAPGGSAPPAVNGGALLAAVLRAVLGESPHPHPVATSAHFLRVPQLAPAQVEVTWLKQGGTAATARAALVQDGSVILDTTVTTGTVPGASTRPGGSRGLAGSGDGLHWTGPPPGFPAIEDCVDLGMWPGTTARDGTAGYAAQVEVLFDPATVGWRRDEPSGLPETRLLPAAG
jgi:Thioesterase-like superfamily